MATPATSTPPARPHRRWRLAVRIVAAVLVGGVLGSWWLLGSGSGRDVLLEGLVNALPEGALRIGDREGSLGGGLRLRDVVFEHDAAHIAIDQLDVTPRWPGITASTIHLASLRVRGVRVALNAVDESPEVAWPGLLPTLDLPLALRIDAIDVRDLRVQPAPEGAAEGRPPLVIERIAAMLDLRRGRLALDAFELVAPEGHVRGLLRYAPAEGFATQLALDGESIAGARFAARLDGTLATGRATLEGHAGGPVAMVMDWQDASRLETFAWTLALDATRFDTATLGFPAQAPVDVSLQMRGGRGRDGDERPVLPGWRVDLSGQMARDGFTVALRDSQLRLHEGVLHAEPLALSLLDGRVDLTGRYGLDDGALAIVARAETLRWGEAEARVQADGEATVAGTLEAWTADLDLDLARGEQRARVAARMVGDGEAIALSPVAVTTPGGVLEGEARYALDAASMFTVEATMRGFDPAWLAPGWPGRLDARLRVDGAVPAEGPLRYVAALGGLGGTLRGQRIEGDARVEAGGDRLQVRSALRLGDGRLAVAGTLAPAMDLEVGVRTIDVAPWLDGARGVLDGRLGIRGNVERPALEADLALLDAGWGEVALQRLTVRGSLPASADGRLAVRADALSQGSASVGTLALDLEGRIDAGRFTVATRSLDVPALSTRRAGAQGRVEARGAWRSREAFGRGEMKLETLDAVMPALPRLALSAPATLTWRGGDVALPAPACVVLGEDGRVCAEGGVDDARLSGEALDLAWLAPFLPEAVDTPLVPSGRAALQLTRRRAGGGVVTTARLESPEGRLRVGDTASETVFGWNGLVLDAMQSDGWRVDLRADLLPDGRLEAQAAAEGTGALSGEIALRATDLGALELVSPDLAAPRGVIDGRLRLSGTVDSPRWEGAVAAAPFAAELPALGVAIEGGELRLEGAEDGQLRLRGRLPTGDGALELVGQWSDDERPDRMAIRGSEVRVLDTPDGRAWISPALDLELAEGIVRLRGRVDVPRAELALDRFEQGVTASSDVVVVDDPATAATGAGPGLDADLTVALGNDVRLRGFGFDGRLSGELRLRDRVDREPRATGTLQLAGEVRAYGQQLDLERGTLRWGNVAIDEPTIDVRAVRPDSDPEVGVAVTGTGLSPIVDVWSRPALPQAEALSWLMFGRPLAAADGNDAAQLQQAATSLGGSVVAQAVAGRVGLDTASVGESRALGGTALTVGKRITPKLYVSYGMALSGTGQVVTVTYALRRWLAAKVETGIEQRVELEAKFERD